MLVALGYRHLYIDDPAPDLSDPLKRSATESPQARRAYEILASFGKGVDARAGELTDELGMAMEAVPLPDQDKALQARRDEVDALWSMLEPDRERMADLARLGELAGLLSLEDALDWGRSYRTLGRGARLRALLLAADGEADHAAELVAEPFRISGRLLRASREAFPGITFVAGEFIAIDVLIHIASSGSLSTDSLRALESWVAEADMDDLAIVETWARADIAYLHPHMVSISRPYKGALGIPRLLPNATTRAHLLFLDQQIELIKSGMPEAARALEEQPESEEPGFLARNAAGRSDFRAPGFSAFSGWDLLQRRRARLQELRDAIDMAQLTSHVAAD